jgi:hypothetical protein
MKVMRIFTCFLLAGILPVPPVHAAPLERAEVTRVFKEVKLLQPGGTRDASPGDEVSGKTAVRTGSESKAELRFSDATLARMGANTIFSFEQGTRDLNLENGTMLLQVPKKAGGATIRTAAVTAAITGTTLLMEFIPGENGKPGIIKLIMLEGTARLFFKDKFGESILLKAGEMIVLSTEDRVFPQKVPVDLAKIYETSGLIQGGFARLDSYALIQKEIDKQRRRFVKGDLVKTNVVIVGSGATVNLIDPDVLLQFDDRFDPPQGRPGPRQDPEDPQDPENRPGGPGNPPQGEEPQEIDPEKLGDAPVFPGMYTILPGTVIVTDPTIDNGQDVHEGKIFRGDGVDGAFSDYLYGTSSEWDVENGLTDPGFIEGNIGVFKFDELVIDGSPIYDTTGGPTAVALLGRNGIFGGEFGASFDTSGLDALLLATEDGSIYLNNVEFIGSAAGLYMYARGVESYLGVFDGVDMPNADLTLISEGQITLGEPIRVRTFFARANYEYGDASYQTLIEASESIEIHGRYGVFAYGEYRAPDVRFSSTAGEVQINGYFPVFTPSDVTGGTVNAANLTAVGQSVYVNEANITATGASASSSRPAIELHSLSDGSNNEAPGITITNSSQLKAIANAAGTKADIVIRTEGSGILISGDSFIETEGPGGRIEIVSNGGRIEIDEAEISSADGTVIIDTLSPTVSGNVTLNNATLNASVLKVRAFGPNGVLQIGGSTLTAGDTLRLYADGSNGRVQFVSDTIINNNGTNAAIAGRTVGVDPGATVTINGNTVRIYLTNQEFILKGNGNETYGNIVGPGAPDSVDAFENRPGF